jgi:hypothetical protein
MTIKSKLGLINTISGHISGAGKDHILLIDQDKKEFCFKKSNVVDVKCITYNQSKLRTPIDKLK